MFNSYVSLPEGNGGNGKRIHKGKNNEKKTENNFSIHK